VTQLIDPMPAPTGAMALETYELTKRFGSLTALDQVTMKVEAGSVHALLGENGAGKSTLVKCVAGFQRPDAGSIVTDGREQDIATPVVARTLGIGMVYQHFTLAPGMTVAENLALGRLARKTDGSTGTVWSEEKILEFFPRLKARLKQFLASTPFTLDLDACPLQLAAGEKQKLELLKQLYLKPRLLILDEPTSVLTPQEADEVLGHVRDFARAGHCTVLIITHKFREVMAYADDVTVLRRGARVHHCAVRDTTPAMLAQAMVGDAAAAAPESGVAAPSPSPSTAAGSETEPPLLRVSKLNVAGDRGTLAVRNLSLEVRAGGAGGPAKSRRRRSAGHGRTLCGPARREPSPEGAQPARGAAAQRLRG